MGIRRRGGHAFGARIALASRQLFFRREQTARPATFAPIRPGCTSESRESRGTFGAGRDGVEGRTDFAPEGRGRLVGGVVRAAGARGEAEVGTRDSGGRQRQRASHKFSPWRFTEGGSI
eukprot:895639-Prymnesium_polylepis.1